MKHIIKVNNILEAKDNPIRPIVALDDSGVLFVEGVIKVVPEGFVDLGLPSGTLWSASLLGATNGDTAESWYGNYYAWGELEEKAQYSWANYNYANGSEDALTKYCNNAEYGNEGFTDELTQLVPEDDVATVTNSAWRMPTKTELEELMTLPSQWVNNYDPNKTEHTADDGGIQDLNGRVFTGNNGNKLFIPAAGYRIWSEAGNDGYYCFLWSSNLYLDNPTLVYELSFSSDDIHVGNSKRYIGHSVCPVCK